MALGTSRTRPVMYEASAESKYAGRGLLHLAGGRPVAVVAEADVPAVRGQPAHGGRADTARAPAHQRDPAVVLAQRRVPPPARNSDATVTSGSVVPQGNTPVAEMNGR